MTTTAKTPSRLLVLLVVTVAASFLLLAFAVTSNAGAAPEGEPATTSHVVVLGDTLWDIAVVATPPGGDVRRTLHDIRRRNGLESSIIHPGDLLVVPVD